ncbi:hypothetical protein BJ912DRAFT_933227 [Pholiota molesta]|nr:hypothetical protein BJ912DRAFT_933227 [Pholiota molesta]
MTLISISGETGGTGDNGFEKFQIAFREIRDLKAHIKRQHALEAHVNRQHLHVQQKVQKKERNLPDSEDGLQGDALNAQRPVLADNAVCEYCHFTFRGGGTQASAMAIYKYSTFRTHFSIIIRLCHSATGKSRKTVRYQCPVKDCSALLVPYPTRLRWHAMSHAKQSAKAQRKPHDNTRQAETLRSQMRLPRLPARPRESARPRRAQAHGAPGLGATAILGTTSHK